MMKSTKIGKTLRAIPKGETRLVQIYEGTRATSELVQVSNKFANVAANKWVMVGEVGEGKWFLTAAEV